MMRFRILSIVAIVGLAVYGERSLLHAQAPAATPQVKVSKDGTTPAGQLKQRITVKVENLSAWIKEGNDPGKLQLVLDGRVLKGVTADYLGQDSQRLKFDLIQNSDNRTAWIALLSKTTDHAMPLSVALPDKPPFPSDAQFKLTVYPPALTAGVVLLLIGLFIVFLVLAVKSDIIRDPGPEPAPGDRRYYSLARAQMAWWFFLVAAAYVYIALVTGNYDTLTPSVLALIGISAATGLGSTAIDSSTVGAAEDRQKSLAAEEVSVQTRIAQLETDTTATPPPDNLDDLKKEFADKKGRLSEIQATIKSAPPAGTPQVSRIFARHPEGRFRCHVSSVSNRGVDGDTGRHFCACGAAGSGNAGFQRYSARIDGGQFGHVYRL